MKKILLFILIILLTSCGTFDAVTIYDQQIYHDEEAVIAYEFYNELYENDAIKTKPIIFRKEH